MEPDLKVSIVYCTARMGGLDILENSMRHQTYSNIEVLVVDELHRTPPVGFYSIEPPTKKHGAFWNLSASLNAGVRAASGDLIVLLQDYIWVPPDGIQKFVEKYIQEGPRAIITGVSDQFLAPPADNPQGLYSCWNSFPGPPSGEKVFSDPRKDGRAGCFLTIPVEWEANWCCFPKQMWLDIGGWDEDFDAGWGYEHVNAAERAQFAGYHIFMDISNEVQCYSHIKLFDEQKHRDASPNNQALWYQKYRALERKQAPWRLNYA